MSDDVGKWVMVGDPNTTGAQVARPPMSPQQRAMLKAIMQRREQMQGQVQPVYDRMSEQLDRDMQDGVIGNEDELWKDGAGTNGMLLHAIMRMRKGLPSDI